MNRIFKNIWSRSRGCFVAVSEAVVSVSKAKTTALLVGCALCAYAMGQDIVITSGDYTGGALEGFSHLHFSGNTKNVTIGSINSPNAIFYFRGRKDKPTDLFPVSAPRITVNGDTTVKYVQGYAYETNFNGNVTVTGKIDYSELNSSEYVSLAGYLTSRIEVEKFQDKGGAFWVSALMETGGSTIRGNLNASLVLVSEGYRTTTKKQDYYSTLRVYGDLNADNLFIDTPLNYDDYNDFLICTGTTTITQNVQNNGILQLNKAIIQGVFFNGTGEYVGTEYSDGVGKTSAMVTELDTRNIFNNTALNIGKLNRTSDVSITQSNGFIQVTENWLDNSTITLTGGTLDSRLFGTDKSLGVNNVYTVTGGTLATTNLGSGSTVTVSDNGILKTTTEIAFKDYNPVQDGLNVIGMSSDSGEATKVLTDRFTEYKPGTLADQFLNDVSFTNGKLLITDVNLTETQASDLEKSFKSKICLLIPNDRQN